MILLWVAVSSVIGQQPANVAVKHYQVNAAEAPNNSITPDGKYRIYDEWSKEGTCYLISQDIKSGVTRRLTKGDYFEYPIISPDGKFVAYAWYSVNGIPELRIVGIDGSEPQTLFSQKDVQLFQVYEWSPDSKYIAAMVFQKDRTFRLISVPVKNDSTQILKSQVFKTMNWSFQYNKMSFSRDSRFIAYDIAPQGGWHPRDIFTVPVKGGKEIPLVQHPANDLLLGWTPDGQSILFASDRSGNWDLWTLQVFDGKPQGVPNLVKTDIGNIINGHLFNSLGFTQDGSYYYKVTTPTIELYLANLNTATNKLNIPVKLASHVGSSTSPEWSRDGRYLTYAWGRGTEYDPFMLAIRSAKTGKERLLILDKLIRHGGHDFQPRWSPDGRFILGVARDRNYTGPGMDSQGIYQINVKDGSITPIVQTTDICGANCIISPVWCPDGRVIFKRRFTESIVTRDIATGEEKELYRAPRSEQIYEYLAVSQDSKQLAFVMSDSVYSSEKKSLMVLSATESGKPRELLQAPKGVMISFPAWMPDSRHILFFYSTGGDEPKYELWRISMDGGKPEKLGLAIEGLKPQGLSIHPDGKRIAFTAEKRFIDEIWVLKNFLPVLHKYGN